MKFNSLSISALLTTVLLAVACDGADMPNFGEDVGAVGFRDAGFWDSVLCLGANNTICFAHRPEGADIWSPALSDCDLDRRIERSGWVETDNGYSDACDFGGHPQTFPEYRCFVIGGGPVSCYGGDDGWYTLVGPSCATGDYTSNVWMPTSCDVDKQIGAHDYDYVFVSPTTKKGRVFDGPDHFSVVPTCNLAGLGVEAGPGGC